MTRRGGREVSERRNGISEDERRPEMVRLAARWRRSNLVILETIRVKHKYERAAEKLYTEEKGTP